jgi:Plasmid pRiA4b ORF-3-like protein
MVFKFKIISDKVENFALHIDADAKNTFFELHEAIQDECKYDPSEIATFFLADEEWDKGLEITMFENKSSKQNSGLIMKNATLGDYLKEKEDKLIYVFDVKNQKSLYIELNEIVMEKKINTPVVTYNRGLAPTQSASTRYDTDLLANDDSELQNIFTDFGELEDLNMIYGEIGEVI